MRPQGKPLWARRTRGNDSAYFGIGAGSIDGGGLVGSTAGVGGATGAGPAESFAGAGAVILTGADAGPGGFM